MTEIVKVKPPLWFWIVSAIALIWNILGIAGYFAQTNMPAEAMAALPQEQQDMYANLPSWYMIAFAIAVFAGALGCIALLLRKKWAYIIFIISAIAVVIQMSYLAFGIKMASAMTPLIVIVSLALIYLAKYATSKQWIS